MKDLITQEENQTEMESVLNTEEGLMTKPVIVATNILRAVKGGRCFNGAHRDGGQIVHAVNTRDGKEPNGYWGDKSLCGTEPGRRGYGWSKTDKDISCQKCLKKLSLIIGN